MGRFGDPYHRGTTPTNVGVLRCQPTAMHRPMNLNAFNPRERIATATSDLFSHVEYPLAHSLDHRGDPGLFGPGSPTWRVIGDVSAMIGGVRALLIQSAHPEVVAGVADHSTYRQDPLGRLSRTTAYVTATAYGAMPEVEAALGVVRVAHRPVTGVSERGIPYSAVDPDHASWVHNVLVDSFLTSYQVFARSPINDAAADEFVKEQTALGHLLRATDTPTTHADLTRWVNEHPQIAPTRAMADVVAFLSDPPLPRAARLGYARLFKAAVATIPEGIRTVLGVAAGRQAIPAGRRIMSGLRWSLGASPSWLLALDRMNASAPPDVTFRGAPPIDGAEDVFSRWQRQRG